MRHGALFVYLPAVSGRCYGLYNQLVCPAKNQGRIQNSHIPENGLENNLQINN